MSAFCHLSLTCCQPAVKAIKLNDKNAREILTCQWHLDELKKVPGVVVAVERPVGPQAKAPDAN